MTLKQDLYKVLGIDKTATKDEVKRAYKKKASKTHPDAGGSVEAFKEVNFAYMILFDNSKRKKYDNGEDVDATSNNKDAMMHQAQNEVLRDIMTFLKSSPQATNSNLMDGLIKDYKTKIRDNKNTLKKIRFAIKQTEELSKRLSKNKQDATIDLAKVARDTVLSDMKKDFMQLSNSIRCITRCTWLVKNYNDSFVEPQFDPDTSTMYNNVPFIRWQGAR